MPHIAIIGGGIGGLACAHALLPKDGGEAPRITLFDQRDRLGGVIRSSQRDGFLLEHGPDSIIRIKPAGMRLIEQLGLSDALQGTNPELTGSFISKGDRLLPIPDGLYLMAPGKLLPFALSPLLSLRGKLRTACDLILPRRPADAAEESLAAFVRRRLGQEALERIAQPLVGGIYTADPERLSLSHCMPQFPAMEAEHRSLILAMRRRARAAKKAKQAEGTVSGARYGLFVSLQGGLQRLVDRLQEVLAQRVDLRPGCAIAALTGDASGWRLTDQTGQEQRADAVVLAMPAHAAAELLRPTQAELAADLASIPYAGVATVNIAFDRQAIGELPAAAGFVVPAMEKRNLIACTFASTKYTDRSPDDGVLLRAFVGGALQAAQLDVDDDTLVARVLADLRRWLPLGQATPRFTAVHRWPAAMAQPVIGHADTLARIRQAEASASTLALVGNGFEGVGIPDIIQQASAAADRLLATLSQTREGPDHALHSSAIR